MRFGDGRCDGTIIGIWSWAELIPYRFTPRQHTRVAGVILFSFATYPTVNGFAQLPTVKLIPNPYAYAPLPSWICEVVAEAHAENRRITQRSQQ